MNERCESVIKSYKTVAEAFAEASFVEKKSEFIGYVARVESEEQAKEFIVSVRARHADATHNCYAYLLKNTGSARFSDDGEPGGTAGLPMLEVIKREGVSDVCVVVTRYFGGILLGAGGLVRAYGRATKSALDAAGYALFVPYTAFRAQVGYAEHEKIQHELPKYGVFCDKTEYAADVTLYLRTKEEYFERFRAFLSEYTAGRAVVTVIGETYGRDDVGGAE